MRRNTNTFLKTWWHTWNLSLSKIRTLEASRNVSKCTHLKNIQETSSRGKKKVSRDPPVIPSRSLFCFFGSVFWWTGSRWKNLPSYTSSKRGKSHTLDRCTFRTYGASKRETVGNSLEVHWLGRWGFIAFHGGLVLIRELRSLKPCGTAQKKIKE